MKVLDRLGSLDRRYIYLVIGVSVLVPFLARTSLPIRVSGEVQAVYDRIERVPNGSYIMVACEYDPSTMAEMRPMTYAVLAHCFRKDLKVIVTCLMTSGVSLIEQDVRKMASEHGKKYGVDWVYLGYKPYPAVVIMSMGEDFRDSFPLDYYDTRLDDVPMMRGIRNYKDVNMVMNINSTSGVDYWIAYGHERYRFDLALGVTAVMATDYYPFIQSGQVVGLMGGMVGAAEYEKLVGVEGLGTRGANVLSVAHFVIFFCIVLSNVNYFYSVRKRRKAGGAR